MDQRQEQGSRGLLAAALGGGIGGTGVYLAISLINPTNDVTTQEFLTLGQYADLELEALSIMGAVIVSVATALIGVWTSLWVRRHPFAFVTTLVYGPLLVFGGAPTSEIHSGLARAIGIYDWPLWPVWALWPFAAGAMARGIVIVVLKRRAIRSAGTLPRFADRWP
jgi:hypothetical protein